MPDVDRIDYAAHPELSFLRLKNFYMGQRETAANSLFVKAGGGHRSPRQMAAKGAWRNSPGRTWPRSLEDSSSFELFLPPFTWPVITNPGHH